MTKQSAIITGRRLRQPAGPRVSDSVVRLARLRHSADTLRRELRATEEAIRLERDTLTRLLREEETEGGVR